jgi:hypothetical protein
VDDKLPPIEFDDTENKGNGLIHMRGVILQFRATTGTGKAGVSLKPDDFIQVKISAELKGGPTVDLNDYL